MLATVLGLPMADPQPYIAKRGDVLRAMAHAGHGQAIFELLLAAWDELTPSWGASGCAFSLSLTAHESCMPSLSWCS